MNKNRVFHTALAAATVALGIIISALSDAKGPLAHAHWAPIALALAVNVRSIIAPPTAAILAAFVALGSLQGCAHTPTPAPDCKTAAEALLGEVASALIQENWDAAVSSLITDAHGGLCAVELALQWISKTSGTNASAPNADSLEALKAGRAKAWIAAHGSAS